jgi:hypothetical protein
MPLTIPLPNISRAFLGRRPVLLSISAGTEVKLRPVSSGPAQCPFTGTDRCKRADDRDLIAVALGFYLEHGIAVLLVKECDALDQPGKTFGEWRSRFRLQKSVRLGANGGNLVLTNNDAPRV